ncbi:copper amine oxidase N-terminal domain-containing protein [Paenibacillus agaridevorans]|uniref:copper amine oxidase N-terminal domain-containing protein n=1 Tax=Paenibacillus agaridevorans TaxID=171404 RepID=UPI001BE3F7A6|nr:copper amine oxidase N-terminal domain-containing protein [Paenibacillus agaridevorans]
METSKRNARVLAAAVFVTLLLSSYAGASHEAGALDVDGNTEQSAKAASLAAIAEDKSPIKKLDTESAAINQAIALKLIPQQADHYSGRLVNDIWTIQYTMLDWDREGTIGLNAETGLPVSLDERLGRVSVHDDNVPIEFLGEEKVTYAEAVSIAEAYTKSQGWDLDTDWTLWRYPHSYYSLRFETSVYHRVEFVRSFEGIRYDNNRFIIYVDRELGKAVAHSLTWSDTEFITPDDMISLEEAATTFYRKVEPVLEPGFWPTDAGDYPPQYKAYSSYTIHANGDWAVDHNSSTSAPTKEIVAAYPRDIAKKRLLSLFDLEQLYLDDSPGQASLYYQLRVKPEVPITPWGDHPFIYAHTGEWLVPVPDGSAGDLPPASDWLINLTAPASAIDYNAAVVWNNKFLPLRDEPVIRNGSTLLPFRELLEKLGASVLWDPAKRKVTARKGDVTIELTIGSGSALVNGKSQTLGAPATIVNGRTYIPARMVLEAFGAHVSWNEQSRLVLVNTGETSEAPALSEQEIGQLRFTAQINWEEKHSR